MNYFKITIMVLILQFSFSLKAAEFCVTTAFELHNALATAESNGTHDTIKVAEGSYKLFGNPFSYQETNGKNLTISGGWTDFQGNPCGQQLSNNPYGTVLDGNLSSIILEIELSGNGDLDVSGFNFINGYTATGRGGAINVSHVNALETGKVTINRNVFINNEAEFGSALYLRHANEFQIRNNLFFANNAHVRYVVSTLQINAFGSLFTNNTVLNNTVTADDIAGVGLSGSHGAAVLLANNIIRDNEGLDLRVQSASALYLKNNNIDKMNTPPPIEDLNNIDLPARFENSLLSFTPAAISPLVNAGTKPCSICPIPIPFDDSWAIGTIDLAGNIRNQKGKVDIGAFESSHDPDLIFWGTFD
ncbi:MAG: hypothetical protein DWP95_08080 [Proteobacteria bacterium]|nr:MAG: hypothetical protein DWP95_08080 [Pseudomonadota bacterium]